MMNKSIILIICFFCTLSSQSLVFPPYGHSYGIRKAKPAHLFMLLGPRTAFDDPQGLTTTRLEMWEDTTTKNDDDEVVVYGINSARHEIIYNTSMFTLSLYGEKGNGIDQFYFPKGIAAEPKGNVFIADSGNNRVVHLYNPRKRLQWKNSFNGKSVNDSGLKGPSRISLDEDCNVYVNDPGNRRLVVFSKDGALIRTIPEPGKYLFDDGPTALVVADGKAHWSKFGYERVIFCADKKGTRLWKMNLDGSDAIKTNLPEKYHASYAAIDYYHNIWITDTYNHCILKYDHNLQLLDIFGRYGTDDNQFVEPRGIAIYKRFGQVFVAEKKGAQYYWIGTELKKSELKKISPERYALTLNATEFSFVSLFSTSDEDTTFFINKRFIVPGTHQVSFFDKYLKLKNNHLTLKIEPTYSSYTYNAWYYPVTVNDSKDK